MLILATALTTGCPKLKGDRPYRASHGSGGPSILPAKKEDIPKLLRQLRERNGSLRNDAAAILSTMDHEPGVIEDLIEALGEDEPWGPMGAAECIHRMQTPPVETLPALIGALDNPDTKVLRDVTNTIIIFGPDAVDATSALTRILNSGDRWVRLNAASALGEIGPGARDAIPHLIKALNDTGKWLPPKAASALSKMGSLAEEAIPTLIETCEVTWSQYSIHGENIFVQIGPAAIPFLMEMLGDEYYQRRASAADTLAEFGPEVAPGLVGKLREQNPYARDGAALALRRLGPKAKDVVPDLISLLSDENVELRGEIAKILGEIGHDAEEAVPLLLQMLHTEEGKVLSHAKIALKKIGFIEKAHADGIVKALLSENISVRNWVLDTISTEDRKPHWLAPELVKALEGRGEDIPLDAVKVLVIMSPDPKVAAPYLTGMLDEWLPQTKNYVIPTLRQLGFDSEEAFAALIAVLSREDTNTQTHVWKNLGEIGAVAVPSLIQALKEENPAVRMNAIRALRYIGPDAVEAVSPLIEALDEDDYEMRLHAAIALGNIGPGAYAALPKLRELAEDDPYINAYRKEYTVRKAAREAIEKIEAGIPAEETDSSSTGKGEGN
jgi:HEAT repeat protein